MKATARPWQVAHWPNYPDEVVVTDSENKTAIAIVKKEEDAELIVNSVNAFYSQEKNR